MNPSSPLALNPGVTLSWRPAITVFLLIILLHLWQLGTPPMAGTEGHRALTAHQMVSSGDWLVPHLWGNVYLRKPPLQYWFIATLEVLTGQSNTWVWRLPAVICSALLGGLLVRFTMRQAGVVAGWCSGLAYVSLLPLWLQSRSCDIDSANIFFSVLACLALIELHDRCTPRIRMYILMGLVGLGTAGTLLLKAHAATPLILAGWVGPWLANRNRNRKPWDWRLWGPILIGFIPICVWVGLVYQQFQHQTALADTRGLSEMSSNITGHLMDYLYAMLLPITLFIFSLPVSLCLILRGKWQAQQPTDDGKPTQVWQNLQATILLALTVYLLTATYKPRYAYPILPLLCPLAGVLLRDWLTLKLSDTWQRHFTKSIGVYLWALVILHGGLAVLLMVRGHGIDAMLIVSLSLAATGAIACEIHLRKQQLKQSLILLAVVLASLTVPFATYRNQVQRRGGFAAAPELIRLTEDDPNRIILARKVAYDQPELFYYAGRRTSALPRDVGTLIKTYPQATLVLHPSEYQVMAKSLAPYITAQATLTMHGKSKLWVITINAPRKF